MKIFSILSGLPVHSFASMIACTEARAGATPVWNHGRPTLMSQK